MYIFYVVDVIVKSSIYVYVLTRWSVCHSVSRVD